MTPGRILVLGASAGQTCGVRDQARRMDEAFRGVGCSVARLWWERDEGWSVRRTLRELSRWLDEVREAADDHQPEAILVHYSVFTWAHRGLPVYAGVLWYGLSGLDAPLALLLHEFAYPLRRLGWRGSLWALAQRLALLPLFVSCQGAIVTSDERAGWLSSRPWLPSRRMLSVPVVSNLPGVVAGRGERTRDPGGQGLDVGVLGYANETYDADSLTCAIAQLLDRGVDVRLSMIGAPGVASPRGQEWLKAAEQARCAHAVTFTGTLGPAELSAVVLAQDVIVLPDTIGPTPGRTSLAAALSHARPVVALDGPSRWEELVSRRAVIMALDADGLAAALQGLWESDDLRKCQGELGRQFYADRMASGVVGMQMVAFLATLGPEPAAGR